MPGFSWIFANIYRMPTQSTFESWSKSGQNYDTVRETFAWDKLFTETKLKMFTKNKIPLSFYTLINTDEYKSYVGTTKSARFGQNL